MKHFYSSVKRKGRFLRGLVTSYEVDLIQSGANKTDKSTREPTEHTQRTEQMQQFDEYEDMFNGMEDSVFISAEEEKKIQELLQFARKGKINPTNAFDIPVKVLNPELTQNANLRFWKFASELLNASMCIYDKRVENMFQTTHKVFHNLVRSTSNDKEDPNPEETYYQKSRRKKDELMKMEIAQIGVSKHIKFTQFGQLNRDEPQRLNIKRSYSQFHKDVMFQKTLKAFDSNSLKNLFLNIFQQSKTLELNFFLEQETVDIKNQKREEVKQSTQQENFPQFIQHELHKLIFIAKNKEIYQHITRYFIANQLNANDNTQLLDFTRDFSELNFKQPFDYTINNDQMTEINQNDSHNHSQLSRFSFNFVTNEDVGKCLSQELNNQGEKSSNHFPASQQCSRQCLFIEQQEFSILMPRELQFKGSKLHQNKIRVNQKQRKYPKRVRNRADLLPLQLQPQLNKLDILKLTQQSQIITSESCPYSQKFLLDKNMNPFIEIHRRRRKLQKESLIKANEYSHSQKLEKSINKSHIHMGNDPTMLENNLGNSLDPGSHLDETHGQISHDNLSTQGLINLKTYGLRNIREIKETLYNKLEVKKELRLSEQNFPISLNSTFLIFLHLVNEHKTEIRSLQEEQDVIILFVEE